MRKRKHTYIDYLKVDIEGAEWGSLGRFMDDCEDGSVGKKGGAKGKKGKGKGKDKKKGGKGKMGLKEASLAEEKRAFDDDEYDIELIEGGDEETTTSEKGQNKMPVGQLSIEMHLNNDAELGFHDLVDFVERLEGFGMRCVFFEVNYWAAWEQQPKFVEMVWVNVEDRRSVLWKE